MELFAETENLALVLAKRPMKTVSRWASHERVILYKRNREREGERERGRERS